MAVTTTPRDLIEAAYAKSTKNNPGAIATDATELLYLTIRVIRKFYSIAPRVNPEFFGDSFAVTAPGAATPYPRPEGIESLFYIEDSGGTEVIIVPFRERTLEPTKPVLYRAGKGYYSPGGTNDPDPSSDNLTFWGSKRPDDPADLDSTIDALWEEAYNELLILELAAYLANKDGRDEEVAYLATQRDEWLRMFIMFLEHETLNIAARFPMRRLATPSVVPLSDLLIGGTTVKIGRGGN